MKPEIKWSAIISAHAIFLPIMIYVHYLLFRVAYENYEGFGDYSVLEMVVGALVLIGLDSYLVWHFFRLVGRLDIQISDDGISQIRPFKNQLFIQWTEVRKIVRGSLGFKIYGPNDAIVFSPGFYQEKEDIIRLVVQKVPDSVDLPSSLRVYRGEVI